MAPRRVNDSSADLVLLSKEIDTISKFLNVLPISDKINKHDYTTLNRPERIFRLFLDHFMPKNLFPEIIEEDLAYLLAYNLLGVVEKEKLIQDWYKKRNLSPTRKDEPFLQFEDGTLYRSVNDLLEADSRTFGEFLPLILKRIQRLRKFIREPLTCQEATRYLDNIWLSWRPKLSKNDVKVVLYVDAHPFARNKDIASDLDLHENSVAYIINRLKKLFVFRVYGAPNERKLGLEKVLVTTSLREPIVFPYLSAAHELRAGNIVKLYSFSIPLQKRGTVNPLRDLHSSLKEKIDEFSVYQVLEQSDSFSFQYFDINENAWDIDWDAWALWLERILYEEKYHMVSPDQVKVVNKEEKRISFDLKDLEIINHYKNDLRMSMGKLGKLVGMTRAGVRHRVKQLLEKKVFVPTTLMVHMGLDEQVVLFYTGDEEYLQPFKAALFELPVVFSLTVKPFLHSSKKLLVAWLQLPAGSFINFTDTVTSILRESDSIWTAHRYQFRSSAKQIPIEMFDENNNDWRWDKDLLAELKIEHEFS